MTVQDHGARALFPLAIRRETSERRRLHGADLNIEDVFRRSSENEVDDENETPSNTRLSRANHNNQK